MMRYRVLIVLGSLAACLTQAPVSFSDARLPAVSLVTTPALSSPVENNLPHARPETRQLDEQQLAKVRKRFLEAEEAARLGDRVRFETLSAGLEDYPLYDLLQYQWLRRHRGDHQGISDYLEAFPGSRYRSKLQSTWLTHLGAQRDWDRLLAHWEPTRNTTLNCYRALALIESGQRSTGLQEAATLWNVGRSQPDACDPLFDKLMSSELFTEALIWERFDAALRNSRPRLAAYIARQLPDAAKRTSGLWLKLHRDPARHLEQLITGEHGEQRHAMFAHAIERLIRKDIFQAIEAWDAHHADYNIDAARSERIERKLATHLVFEDSAQAYRRFDGLSAHDDSTREWRVRAALKSGNWINVIDAISDLDENMRQSERWRYWLARAYAETGKPLQADEIFNELAQKRDYFGYLAAEHLGVPYQLADAPLDISDAEVRAIAAKRGFRAAFELMILEREHEAKSQWWHALERLPEDQIAAAAKLAQRWQWDEIAIFTVARIGYWDDVSLRFPLSYSDRIDVEATANDIDAAIVFGLIRRESAFNRNAFSHAGARGLMQLMPTTARQVARELNYRWRGNRKLFEAERNITFGTFYLRKMLDRFNGNHAMALAAYNAGPHRVSRWLPDETIAADLWIETIPIRETRDYVANVLAYSMIYQRLLGEADLSLADLSSSIEPAVDLASSE